MAKKRRLAPGAGAQGSGMGGSIDLGAILMGIFGGVAPNPEYGLAAEAQTAPFVAAGSPTEAALRGGAVDKPYKAKTLLDQNQTNRLNANFVADREASDLDSSRRLGEEQKMNSILADRETKTGQAKNEIELQRRRTLRPEDDADQQLKNKNEIAMERIVSGIRMLANKGIDPTERNQQESDVKVTPNAINAASSGYAAQNEQNILNQIQSQIQGDMALQTKPATLGTARAKSEFGQNMAEGELREFPTIFGNKMHEVRQDPVAREAAIRRTQLMPVGEGGGLFNAGTGKLEYNMPSPLDRLQPSNTGGTSVPIQSATTPSFGDLSMDDLIIDPATKKILGVKPRR